MSKQGLAKLEKYILIDSINYRYNRTNYKGFKYFINKLKKDKYKHIDDFCYEDLMYFKFLLNNYIKTIPLTKTFEFFSIKNFLFKINSCIKNKI